MTGNIYTEVNVDQALATESILCANYRLMHLASELSEFTCTSSLTMNEKFQYRTRPPSAVLKNFEFIVSERVQVNPDNS